MIGSLLGEVCSRHGRRAALLCAAKIARATVGQNLPETSMADLEGLIMRRNPADPLALALRVCNAEQWAEFVAGMALLALSKAAVQDDDKAAAVSLSVAGLLMESSMTPPARSHCVEFLHGVKMREPSPEEVEEAIRRFNEGAS